MSSLSLNHVVLGLIYQNYNIKFNPNWGQIKQIDIIIIYLGLQWNLFQNGREVWKKVLIISQWIFESYRSNWVQTMINILKHHNNTRVKDKNAHFLPTHSTWGGFICTFSPSITDGVHRKENFVEIIPVFSTFSKIFNNNFFFIKAILCNFSMRLLKYF